jgi:hypothetical protein
LIWIYFHNPKIGINTWIKKLSHLRPIRYNWQEMDTSWTKNCKNTNQ